MGKFAFSRVKTVICYHDYFLENFPKSWEQFVSHHTNENIGETYEELLAKAWTILPIFESTIRIKGVRSHQVFWDLPR